MFGEGLSTPRESSLRMFSWTALYTPATVVRVLSGMEATGERGYILHISNGGLPTNYHVGEGLFTQIIFSQSRLYPPQTIQCEEAAKLKNVLL